ncbi:MAG: hypothetical protein JW708_09830, partial [Vallitaleaceae bacterium]|nr:hypothetical protein [Vallitaleaceae bacterium]
DGEGVGTETADNGEDVEAESTTKNPETDPQEGDELDIFSIYLVEERIYLDDVEMGAKLVETDLGKLEEIISPFDTKKSRIIIYDGGALSGTYEDVINLVKRYDLVFSEESISLEEDRF